MAVPVTHPCGTPAAAQRHRRAGEPPCDDCRTAERTYNREYARLGRQNKAWRDRQAETKRKWDRAHRQQLNRARREREARARIRDINDRRRLVDRVAVERLIRGEPVAATRLERQTAFNAMRDRGFTVTDCCTRLRTSGSTGNAWESTRLSRGTSTGVGAQCQESNRACGAIATTDQSEVA